MEEKTALQALDTVHRFNNQVKEGTVKRLQSLLEEAKLHADKNGKLWAERTKYKIDIDRKNASLSYLLQRAATAVDNVAAAEAADAKKKDKKDHKGGGGAKSSGSKDSKKKK